MVEIESKYKGSKTPFGMAVLLLRGANDCLQTAINNNEAPMKIRDLAAQVRVARDEVKFNSSKRYMNAFTLNMWAPIYEDAILTSEAILGIASCRLSSSLKCL